MKRSSITSRELGKEGELFCTDWDGCCRSYFAIVQMIEISRVWRRCGDYLALGLRPSQRMNFVECKVTTAKSKYSTEDFAQLKALFLADVMTTLPQCIDWKHFQTLFCTLRPLRPPTPILLYIHGSLDYNKFHGSYSLRTFLLTPHLL